MYCQLRYFKQRLSRCTVSENTFRRSDGQCSEQEQIQLNDSTMISRLRISPAQQPQPNDTTPTKHRDTGRPAPSSSTGTRSLTIRLPVRRRCSLATDNVPRSTDGRTDRRDVTDRLAMRSRSTQLSSRSNREIAIYACATIQSMALHR